MTIEEKTGIIPEAVAEGVIEKASSILGVTLDDSSLVGYLTGCAEATFKANPKFRRRVCSIAEDGNRGRDYLWGYRQHWLSSKLLRDNHDSPRMRHLLVDSGFSTNK